MLVLLIFILLWVGYTLLLSLISTQIGFIILFIFLGLILTVVTFFLVYYLILIPIIKKKGPQSHVSHLILRRFVFLIMIFARVKVEYINRELLAKKDKPVLFVANHKSTLDVLLVYLLIERSCTAVAKTELRENKIYLPLIDGFKVICINRNSDREAAKAISNGIKLMKDNIPLILFPEGGVRTRETEQMVEVRAGAYKLAYKSEASIQPVVIKGTSKLKDRSLFKRSKISLEVLEEIPYEDYKNLTTSEIGLEVARRVNEHFPLEEKIEIKLHN